MEPLSRPAAAPRPPPPVLRRYVALGDSQSEGLHDYHPDGTPRGFADRFAEALAADHPELRYANLAVRGKRTAEIRETQLARALALEPDLASVVSGVNDVVRPRADLGAVANDLEAMYRSLRERGVFVMGCTFPLPTAGLTRRAAPRLRELNARIREAAARSDVLLVDLEDFEVASDLRLWSADRIHLNASGHARLAAAFAATLRGETEGDWRAPLPARPQPGRIVAGLQEAAWLMRFVAPKLVRLARGRSSGDGRQAKRPALESVMRPAADSTEPS